MALFETRNELVCEKCNSNVFSEKTKFMYTKSKGRNGNLVARQTVGEFLECANPNCRHIIDKNSSEFFKDTEIIDKI